MAASSACSSSGDTSKVSSSSRATTVTTDPSAKGSPSKTTFHRQFFRLRLSCPKYYSSRAGNGVSGRNELRAASLDLLDTPLHLDGPSIFNLVVLEKTGNQAIRKRTLVRGKLERLSFQHLELT